MADRATFLHITDAHLSAAGIPFERDDRKLDVPGIENSTRGEVLELLFRRLAERLNAEKRTIDAVLFSGDAQSRGAAGGHEVVLQLVTDHFGIAAEKIVSVPGNHDVPRDSAPGSPQRYETFSRVWRDHGCVVPWLDGIDASPMSTLDRHRLIAADRSWAVYPVNTSNWSHVTSVLPEPLRAFWDTMPETLAAGDANIAGRLRSQLQALARYDMARVSEQQLEALRTIVTSTPQPASGRQLRIAVMHHHLRSPSLREELKPFADMSNLEQVRAWLRGSGIGVVIHGHKHEHAAYFDHIYAGDLDDMHRVLVISGATFEVGRETDAVRLITLNGLPHTPEVNIEPISLPRSGAEDLRPTPILRRLWATGVRPAETVVVSPGSPVTVEGADLDEVYARALAVARTNAKRGTLIVHLDLPDDDGRTLPLPAAYAVPDDLQGDERQTWLRELVEWWQLDRSQLEPRIPYLHGARLRRYSGKIDQIARIIALLRAKPSTRAVAVLVDPFRDFSPNGAGEEFASFCLVEFRRRDADAGRIAVDAIAFYRAQEFERWWPINIAELRFLQREICEELGYRPGRITTIAGDARTISRSPTQVAMPIVDRWLDQAPERLHLVADALVHKRMQGDVQVSAVLQWRRSLVELRAATRGFNADGIPVAIEGLLTLAAYIEATSTTEAELSTLARNLSDLARVNEAFEHSTLSRASFNRWSSVAQNLVMTLERLTDDRLPAQQPSIAPDGLQSDL